MRKPNRVARKLSAGEVPIGIEVMFDEDRMLEIIGWSGFDYVMLDMEHAPFHYDDMERQVRTAQGVGMSTFVRVAINAPTDIRRALETGTDGLVVPRVRGADDVRAALDAMYYAPDGTRGMCPVTRAGRYRDDDWADYVTWLRREVLLMPLIESAEAIEDLEQICELPDIHVIGFGAGDFGQSIGAGADGMSSDAVLKAFHELLRVAARHGVTVHAMPHIAGSPGEDVNKILADGVGMVTYDADALMFSRICREIIRETRGLKAVLDSRT